MERINKSQARKLHAQHQSYIIVPCKCAPTSMFAVKVQPGWCDRNFDTLVNEFTFYNCNSELGRYIHYYAD